MEEKKQENPPHPSSRRDRDKKIFCRCTKTPPLFFSACCTAQPMSERSDQLPSSGIAPPQRSGPSTRCGVLALTPHSEALAHRAIGQVAKSLDLIGTGTGRMFIDKRTWSFEKCHEGISSAR